MDSFPFTRKRLLSLPQARRHKWVASWLRDSYTALLSGKATTISLKLVFQNLKQLHGWLELPLSVQLEPEGRKGWLAFLSDMFHFHQQLTGLGLAESDLLPHVLTGDTAPEGVWTGKLPYIVALDNLRSAFNVGSIFRLVDAAGFESVLMNGVTPGAENRQVEKTAMGATGWIPGKKPADFVSELKGIKSKGYHIIGVETVSGSSGYLEYPWPRRGVVVIGNEEYGISDSVMAICNDFVHIPMSGNKNSINVANAFAVVAFHISSLF